MKNPIQIFEKWRKKTRQRIFFSILIPVILISASLVFTRDLEFIKLFSLVLISLWALIAAKLLDNLNKL